MYKFKLLKEGKKWVANIYTEIIRRLLFSTPILFIALKKNFILRPLEARLIYYIVKLKELF